MPLHPATSTLTPHGQAPASAPLIRHSQLHPTLLSFLSELAFDMTSKEQHRKSAREDTVDALAHRPWNL
jgi:hypothetical protein